MGLRACRYQAYSYQYVHLYGYLARIGDSDSVGGSLSVVGPSRRINVRVHVTVSGDAEKLTTSFV